MSIFIFTRLYFKDPCDFLSRMDRELAQQDFHPAEEWEGERLPTYFEGPHGRSITWADRGHALAQATVPSALRFWYKWRDPDPWSRSGEERKRLAESSFVLSLSIQKKQTKNSASYGTDELYTSADRWNREQIASILVAFMELGVTEFSLLQKHAESRFFEMMDGIITADEENLNGLIKLSVHPAGIP